MPRNLTSGAAAAVTDPVVRPALFVEGQFTGGMLRLWTGAGTIDWNGQTWTGAGNLLSFSTVGETADLRAVGLTIGLSGMPSNISLILGQTRRRQRVRVWLGFFDDAAALVPQPYLPFEGLLDVPEIEDTGESCTIRITYESELRDLERPRVHRYTHEDQQLRAPGDRFFEYVNSLQDQALQW